MTMTNIEQEDQRTMKLATSPKWVDELLRAGNVTQEMLDNGELQEAIAAEDFNRIGRIIVQAVQAHAYFEVIGK